jgi:hypothetical protein
MTASDWHNILRCAYLRKEQFGTPSPTRPARAAPNLAIHPKQTAMNITAANTKADIIDAAMEITDYQQAKINQLQQRQVILFGLVALLSIINLLG